MAHRSIIQRELPYREYNVTFILILVNIVVFFLQTALPGIVNYVAMNPALVIGRNFWWQPVTYMFAHSGVRHILFNMLGLFFFGTQVEDRVGSNEFLLYYMVTGVLAGLFSLLVYYLTGAYYVFLLGASGAVYAVLLAFATYFPYARIFLFGILPIPAPVLVLGFAALSLFSQLGGGGGNVAHLTHLAGFAFGLLYFVLRLRINPIRVFLDSR
ncbi:MAG: rhomboid family intramembrane serine protease [Alkalispirochaetaceae bacterium]